MGMRQGDVHPVSFLMTLFRVYDKIRNDYRNSLPQL